MVRKIEEYDLNKLEKAERLIMEVYTYYFSAPGYKPIENRLETILRKLKELQQIGKEGETN